MTTLIFIFIFIYFCICYYIILIIIQRFSSKPLKWVFFFHIKRFTIIFSSKWCIRCKTLFFFFHTGTWRSFIIFRICRRLSIRLLWLSRSVIVIIISEKTLWVTSPSSAVIITTIIILQPKWNVYMWSNTNNINW